MEAGLADRAFDGAHVLRVVAGTSDPDMHRVLHVCNSC